MKYEIRSERRDQILYSAKIGDVNRVSGIRSRAPNDIVATSIQHFGQVRSGLAAGSKYDGRCHETLALRAPNTQLVLSKESLSITLICGSGKIIEVPLVWSLAPVPRIRRQNAR